MDVQGSSSCNATEEDYLDVARLCVEHGASVDKEDGASNTPLSLALEYFEKALPILRSAMTKGKRRVEKSGDEKRRIDTAEPPRETPVVSEHKRSVSQPAPSTASDVPVAEAAEGDQRRESFAEIDAETAEMETLIADRSFAELVDAVMAKDSLCSVRGRGGRRPLHFAIEQRNGLAVQFLATKHPELIDLPDENGHTALHLAVLRDKERWSRGKKCFPSIQTNAC